ncbi:MAG: hypothetical protein QGG42_10155 [Phycisphaerae bacterium]|nr:hypothetical protein [Phycisphaerae bacterium]
MKRMLGIVSMVLTGLLTCNAIAQRSADIKPVKLTAPELRKVRWQSLDKKVFYAVVDTKGRIWFLRKDQDEEHAQFVCANAPGVNLMLPNNYRILRVDGANRFWIVSRDELWHFDLNTFSKVVKKTKGLFEADKTTGWPLCHPGQVYMDHSSKRVYCHDHTGIHVLDGKQWTFKKWPAEVLGAAGKVDMAAATLHSVEAPGGLAVFWATGDLLKGFWTHDGGLWKHYSSKTDRNMDDITAIVPMERGFVLVCGKSRDAFVVDLASGVSRTVPDTAGIIAQLMRLGHKDPKISAAAKRAVQDMVRADSKKITESAGFISDGKLRKLAMSVIKNTPRERTKTTKTPPAPGLPLRNAHLIAHNSRGDALLTWTADGKKKMGVLRTDGKIVETPAKMSLEMSRPSHQSRLIAHDGSIIIATRRLWKWNGQKFTALCDKQFDAKIELLGVDRSGRIFMEAERTGDYVRAMCDPRYKGVEGSGVVGPAVIETLTVPIQLQLRD